MPLVNPYCTVAQVQAEIRNTDAALATRLEEAVNQASRWIDAHLGRDFYQHDYSTTALVLRRWDEVAFGDMIFLPYRPIIEITEVKVISDIYVAGTDYTTAAGGRLISLVGDWPISSPPVHQGTRPLWLRDAVALPTVEIKGKFGYAQAAPTDVPTGIPLEITRAAILVAAAFSGCNRKVIVGLDGSKEEVIENTIPETVFKTLGPKVKIVL